jgi:transposase
LSALVILDCKETNMKGLAVLDERATGIDVGSERMHVSIGGAPGRVFGTMTCDLQALRDYLLEHDVRKVAVEATGVYWLSLYSVLESAKLDVCVVNGRHVRNLPGRKTDLADCEWLATLHVHGLLRSGFVPSAKIRCLQDFVRLRADHITMAASHVQHMQKAMERMNIKFHAVISSLTGVSGLKVVRSILSGERDPEALLALCDKQIQKTKADLVKESLRGTYAPEHVFALKQALMCGEFYQERIGECDREISTALQDMGGDPDDDSVPLKGKPSGSNTPEIRGLHRMLVQVCGGEDVTKIPGIADHSLLQVLAEVGTDLSAWKTAKHFTSWAGLAPGSKQSGKRNRNEKRHCNRAGRLFCTMARSLAQSVDRGLGGAYRRLRARRGGLVANKALARKLAELFWRALRHGLAFVEHGLDAYHAKVKETDNQRLKKLASTLGFSLVPKNAAPA